MSNNADFYIWTTNRAPRPNACQYYRIDVPTRKLDDMGLAQIYVETAECPQRESTQAMLTANIVHMYSVAGSSALHKVKTIRDMKAGDLGGRMMVPPAVIYDCDDNTDFVHPFNSTFAYLGVRNYPDARLLKPGENLEWADPTGKKVVLWKHEDEDGPASHLNGIPYDVARNLFSMKERHELIRLCDGATSSTRALESYYRDVIGQKNTYVFPNTVIPEDYEQFDVVRKDPDEIRILWQGSASHYVDWYPLRDAIKEISDKYPKVKWVIFGQWFDWVHRMIPDNRVEHHGWTAYEAFKLKRGLLNIDINLCVLANNAFNRCKSAIKWYEGSIWNRPEATLAANVEPYYEIEDGVTGLLYNNPLDFVQKLSTLIENAELCRTLGENAKKWVLANRTPEKTIPGLMEFYQDCHARRQREGQPLIVAPTHAEMKKVLARR